MVGYHRRKQQFFPRVTKIKRSLGNTSLHRNGIHGRYVISIGNEKAVRNIKQMLLQTRGIR